MYSIGRFNRIDVINRVDIVNKFNRPNIINKLSKFDRFIESNKFDIINEFNKINKISKPGNNISGKLSIINKHKILMQTKCKLLKPTDYNIIDSTGFEEGIKKMRT